MLTEKEAGSGSEFAALMEARQNALEIAHTTLTPSGQILDWVPRESQDLNNRIATPPPPISGHSRLEDKGRPVKPATFELDDPSVERGPAGTVPIVRPDVSRASEMVAVKDYLSKGGGSVVNKRRRNKRATDPSPFGYFHAISSQNAKVYGCDGYFSVWDPRINTPSNSGDDHSIMQTWLQNYDKQTQSIEGGWTVDKGLNGDTTAHVFTYYTTNGYGADGDDLGGYNRIYSGWKQYDQSVFPGIRINGFSTVGGQQLEISMKFQLWQSNWWVACQGIWMGYYAANLFNGGLGNYAEWVGFGGEVYSGLSNPGSTQDQMGSGMQAQDGWTRAAFQRNLRNQTDPNGAMTNNDGTPETDTANGGANPYTIQMHMNSGSSWGSYFWVGGPST
jgi:hypothetical protein